MVRVCGLRHWALFTQQPVKRSAGEAYARQAARKHGPGPRGRDPWTNMAPCPSTCCRSQLRYPWVGPHGVGGQAEGPLGVSASSARAQHGAPAEAGWGPCWCTKRGWARKREQGLCLNSAGVGEVIPYLPHKEHMASKEQKPMSSRID